MNVQKIIIFCFFIFNSVNATDLVTIAILAKDKEHCLPFYLFCIENQTHPKNKTYLYIRTNDNNDKTVQVLKDWIGTVKDKYLDIFFDDSDAPVNVRQYVQHEWNCTRFKVLGKIRQESVDWAYNHNSHYFVADCDNFILPHTIETMIKTGLPVVAPLMNSNCAYSNFHAEIDQNGYFLNSNYYLPLINRELKGLIQVPVVHCTYFVHYDVLNQMSYDDDTYRYEYVIFSDVARKKNIPQYLDTRECYGMISFAENSNDLVLESWFINFSTQLYKMVTN